ncbi:uncharacterized protein CLUP02_13312 [Colletotrichum lupini]|uniref:C2H2-type domain-containing protein n=1 Tax=Colletotrichum lupini TaxID=145971 RepID=A0A9Q8T270_9PEZI|nr:uncharacterized protein CLUP02_13312 [Colletotrichum lupini]UQC87793.1 hypothetical protein CLUP02_13312 [Colletotrichum lupini]
MFANGTERAERDRRTNGNSVTNGNHNLNSQINGGPSTNGISINGSRNNVNGAHVYVCYYGYCGQRFTTEAAYSSHVDEEHQRRPSNQEFPCTYPGCGTFFSVATDWTDHELEHDEEYITNPTNIYWVCSEPRGTGACNTSFTAKQRTQFAEHLVTLHGVGRSWSAVIPVLGRSSFPIYADGFYCPWCVKGIKYNDPDFLRSFVICGLDQPLRLDHLQRHMLDDGNSNGHLPTAGKSVVELDDHWLLNHGKHGSSSTGTSYDIMNWHLVTGHYAIINTQHLMDGGHRKRHPTAAPSTKIEGLNNLPQKHSGPQRRLEGCGNCLFDIVYRILCGETPILAGRQKVFTNQTLGLYRPSFVMAGYPDILRKFRDVSELFVLSVNIRYLEYHKTLSGGQSRKWFIDNFTFRSRQCEEDECFTAQVSITESYLKYMKGAVIRLLKQNSQYYTSRRQLTDLVFAKVIDILSCFCHSGTMSSNVTSHVNGNGLTNGHSQHLPKCYYGYCGRRFTTMAEHETHEETHDIVPDGFSCTFCASPYSKAQDWRACEESHTGDRIQDLNGIYWVCSLLNLDNDSGLCNTSFKVTQRFEFAGHLIMMHATNRCVWIISKNILSMGQDLAHGNGLERALLNKLQGMSSNRQVSVSLHSIRISEYVSQELLNPFSIIQACSSYRNATTSSW